MGQLAAEGATPATSLADLVGRLSGPRALWIMIPSVATGPTIEDLGQLLDTDDVVIDGGNSHYRHDVERAPARIAEFWRRGSVAGPWLVDLTASSLPADADLTGLPGRVPDPREEQENVLDADDGVPAFVLPTAPGERFGTPW